MRWRGIGQHNLALKGPDEPRWILCHSCLTGINVSDSGSAYLVSTIAQVFMEACPCTKFQKVILFDRTSVPCKPLSCHFFLCKDARCHNTEFGKSLPSFFIPTFYESAHTMVEYFNNRQNATHGSEGTHILKMHLQ